MISGTESNCVNTEAGYTVWFDECGADAFS